MILTKSIPAILCFLQGCRQVAAQACPFDEGYGFEDFEPYFFMNEMGTTPTCNIDPSQAKFDYAVAVGGEFCLTMSDPVTIGLYYTGVNGLASSATATTVIAETSTSSLDLIFTGLPAKSISNGSPITVAIYEPSIMSEYCGTAMATTTLLSDYVAIQTFVSTLVMTDATATFTSTVPTTTGKSRHSFDHVYNECGLTLAFNSQHDHYHSTSGCGRGSIDNYNHRQLWHEHSHRSCCDHHKYTHDYAENTHQDRPRQIHHSRHIFLCGTCRTIDQEA